jgi:transcriptional regulator with XRE-family HTH domain
LNERIKELRKALGLTLDKFGERLGVSKVAISLIENGKNSLTDQMFKSICREFNVREEWLRTGEEPMFIQMSRDEEIASFINSIQQGCTDSFKKRFIKVLASLDESDWKFIEEKAIELCQPYIDAAASAHDKSDTPIIIRAAHENPGATKEQIEADNALMESDDF